MVDINNRQRADMQILQLSRLYATLSQINQTIVRVQSQAELFESICKVAIQFGEFRLAWIGFYDSQSGQVTPAVTSQPLPFANINIHEMPFKQSLIDTALQTGRIAFSNDIQTDPNMLHWHAAARIGGYHSAAALPLRQNGKIIGLLNLFAADRDFFAAEQEQKLMDEIALDISFALDMLEREAKRKQAEEALRESEATLKKSQETAHVGHWSWDTRTNLLVWSDEMYRIFGYEPGSAPSDLAEVIAQAIHPDDREKVNRVNESVIIEQKPAALEYRVVWSDGSIHTVWAKPGDRFTDENGVILRLTGIVQDITERKQREDALLESNLRLNLALTASGIGIHVLDYRTNELIWDERIYEFWGLPLGTPVTYELFLKGIHPNDLKRVEAAVDYLNDPNSGGKYLIQYRVIGIQTGIERCLELTGQTFYEDGKPSRFVGTAIDITERKRAEEQITHLVERFDLATHAAHLGVWDWDITLDQLVWDDRMYELYGVKREDFSGAYETWLKGLHPDDRALSDEISKQSLRGEKEYNTEFRVVMPDGSIRWLRSFGQVIRNADGKPQRMIGINFDITEQKQAEERLKASEARYRRLFENMQEAFFVVEIIRDESGNPLDIYYLEVNTACLSRAGREKREEMVGHTYLELFFPNPTFDLWLAQFSQVALTGKSDHFEQFAEATGLYFEVFAYSPQLGQCAVVLNDITERKRAEEDKIKLQEQLLQSQKLESIGRLAGGVAHDYNNMLGIIIGRCETAMSKLDPREPVYADLREILQAAERSAALSRQLLTFARKQPVNAKVMNLNNTISDMIGMHRRLIGENIELSWMPASHLWTSRFDPSQVNQILANLLINARDAIVDTGKITVETVNEVLSVEDNLHYPGMPAGEYVVLTVTDTGCGMESEILIHIFEPFFTTKEIGKGTGLGLATVFGIVKQNDGYIFVTSQTGKGTIFKIYLPRFEEESYLAAEQVLSNNPLSGGNETVLIVEDEEALLQLGQETLEELGYTVLAASSPKEGLRMATEHYSTIDLLITDVVMPGMNGRDLAEKIKAICPGSKCLFMSGYTADIITQHEVLSEEVFFIQKPFRLNELADTVRRVLGK